MISNLSAASEFVNVLNNSHFPSNESYALISLAGSELATSADFQQCSATDMPEFEKLGNNYPEPVANGVNICTLVQLVVLLLAIDLVLIMFALLLKISILFKELFQQGYRNGTNNVNENNSTEAQPRSIPLQEDSACCKGDQLQNGGHRRQRRSLRSTLTSSPDLPTSLHSAANSLPLATAVPVTALIACSQEVSPCIASALATQMTTSGSSGSPQDSSEESNRIVRSILPETEEFDPCKVQFVRSQLKNLQPVRKALKKPDSDRSERKHEEDITEFSSVLDPASAQHHADSDDSSKESKAQPDNHRTSKSAKKRMEIPVLVETPCAARCGLKMEQQFSSSSSRSKVPVFVMPHKLCDFDGNSCLIPECKSNEGMSCGTEYQLRDSELEVRRSRNGNEAPDVEQALIPSKYGSIPFEKDWEQRTPLWQEKREHSMSMNGMNCEALLAIDALLEEEDDTMEMTPDEKKTTIKPRDLLLPTKQVMGRSM